MDYRIWFTAGRAFWEHREFYSRSEPFSFMYPPGCAFLLAWPAIGGKAAFIFFLGLLNTAAWIFSVSALGKSGARVFALLCANLLVLVYIWSSYHLGQPSIVLLALMLGAFAALKARRNFLAGTLLAIAVGIKAFPFLVLPYLIWRRYWLATAALLLALATLLFVLPLPWRGTTQTLTDFQSWRTGMLRYDANGIAQRQLRGYSWKNQSIFGFANRMLRRVSAEESSTPLYANVTDVSFATVNLIIVALALLVGLSYLAVMPRLRSPETDALEWAALLLLILIFTPLAFGYLFVWLMAPLALLLSRWLRSENLVVGAGLIIATILLACTAVAPRTAQIYGSVLFAALTLYLTIAVELWRAKSMAPPVLVAPGRKATPH